MARWRNMTDQQREVAKADNRKRWANRTEKQRRHRVLWSAMERAKKQGVPFSITHQDINDIWPKDNCCPALGRQMVWATKKCTPNSPTLDKINPQLGYVVGNIAIVCYLANAIMQNALPSEVTKVAQWFSQQVEDWNVS
tara:strand:- start:128 stop:544 length:417 start_codon:yes stop_codon:yes gene_type:complete